MTAPPVAPPIQHSTFDIQHSTFLSSVHLTKNDVDGADQRHQIRHQMSLCHGRQGLEVYEAGRTDVATVGVLGLAVTDDVVAQLSLRGLDRVVDLPFGWADHP